MKLLRACDEHWVLYATTQSLNTTSKTATKKEITKQNKNTLNKTYGTDLLHHYLCIMQWQAAL